MDGAFLSAHSMDDERNQTTVIFACPKCGLAHEVTQEHVPAKMSGGFDCADCGTAVHSWYGFFDYSNWKAIKIKPVARQEVTDKHPNETPYVR
jgi:predicted RNA-binding Zn-ribbon protein involved in translation (DUF1610 family)